MADIITNQKTVDIQIVDETRADTTTVKLDNPRENLTKADVSAAFTDAFANGWLLTNKGSIAKYLGDVTINTSTKVKLGGSDYYVTPSTLSFTAPTSTAQVTVSGAYIQGYNITNVNNGTGIIDQSNIKVSIAENGLIADVSFAFNQLNYGNASFDLILVIQGVEVTVPATVTRPR